VTTVDEEGFLRIAYSEVSSVVLFGDWTIAYQIPETPLTGDFAPADCDVVGSDLAALIADSGSLDITTFAQNFGKIGCQ
jgi:hypothetical protein